MRKRFFIIVASLIVVLSGSISPATADSVSICDFRDAENNFSLTKAVLDIGTEKKTLYIDFPATITANTLVPQNISLAMEYPGSIAPDGGTYSLAINGPFYAEHYKVFSGFSAVNVTFGSASIKEALPQWWGAVVDDTTDDTAAVHAALAAYPRVYLSAGIWKMNIIVAGDKEIYGTTGTILRAYSGAGGNPIILVDGVNQYILNARVHDLYFQGNTADEKLAVGLKLSAQPPNVVTMSSFKNLWFDKLAKAIFLTSTSCGASNNSFDHISIIYPGTHGIHNDKGGYNRFTNVTCLYAEDGKQPYSIYNVGGDNVYKNVQVDNPIYSDGASYNNAFEDVVVQTIASDPPVTVYAVSLAGYFDSIRNLLFQDVDNATTPYGLNLNNGPHVVSNVSWTGTLKPNTILLLQPGSYGTLDRITPSVNSIWQGNDAALWSWDIIGSASRAKPFLDKSPATTANEFYVASESEPQYMYLSRDYGYEFEFDIKNTTGADITYGIYFSDGNNWDYTEPHYRSIYTVNDSGTMYGSYWNNTSWLIVPNAANAHVTGTISLTPAGQVVIDYHAMVGVTRTITGHYKLVPASPWSEVRQMVINGRGASKGIAPDSTRFRMWRKTIS